MQKNRIHAKQLTLTLSVIATVALAVAVFAWGLQFKCSLYHQHPEKHPRMLAVKLLSERERPSGEATAAARSPLPHAPLFAFWLTLFGLLRGASTAVAGAMPQLQSDVGVRRRPCLTRFSFRPPPANLL